MWRNVNLTSRSVLFVFLLGRSIAELGIQSCPSLDLVSHSVAKPPGIPASLTDFTAYVS